MKMLERIERAVADSGPVGCCSIGPREAKDIVRAALEAMREPSEAMRRNCVWTDDHVAEWMGGVSTILGGQV